MRSLEPELDAGWGVSGQWVEEQLAQGDPRMEWKSKAREKVERLNLKRQGQRARTHPIIQEQRSHLARRRVSTSLEQGIWTREWEWTLDVFQEKLESSQGHFYRAHMVSAESEEGSVKS